MLTAPTILNLRIDRDTCISPNPIYALIFDTAAIKTGYTEDANAIPVTIRFTEKTKLGTHINFHTRPAGLLTLIRWIEQVQPQNLGGMGREPPNSPGTATPLSQ